jgi:hypothetical protein
MLQKIKNSISLNENKMYLGKKRVDIAKLTPKLWRELFETVDKLPGLIMQVILAPKEDFYAYVLTACEVALSEVIEVVSVLTGLDTEYVEENVGIDEIVLFLIKTAKRNNLDDVTKNLKSLLLKEQ